MRFVSFPVMDVKILLDFHVIKDQRGHFSSKYLLSSLTKWVFLLSLSLVMQMESPVSTPAPPPLHLLASVGNSDIASPCEQLMVRTRSVAVNTSDVALSTEPECLGPCEPGTSVNLEGIVWQETEDGKDTADVSISVEPLFRLAVAMCC